MVCLTGIESRSPSRHARVNGVRGVLDHEVDLAADEAQPARSGSSAPGKQARLAEHLEAVADAEHRAALAGELGTASITGEKRAIAPARR